jgi:hypothetical protein
MAKAQENVAKKFQITIVGEADDYEVDEGRTATAGD